VTSKNGRRNERLAEAIAQRGVDRVQAAEAAGVDPRTIDRWIADRDRIPYAASREALSNLLEVPATVLWPNVTSAPQSTRELVAMYPNRRALPPSHVMGLLMQAEQRIDLLALAATWLWDAVPGFGESLAIKADSGLAVRVCLGDPFGESARARGREEGIGNLMTSRCQLALGYAREHLADHLDAIRLHDTTLYASILRFDDQLLVNWHLYGAAAKDSPVLHVRDYAKPGVAQSAIASFERVWSSAYPPTG